MKDSKAMNEILQNLKKNTCNNYRKTHGLPMRRYKHIWNHGKPSFFKSYELKNPTLFIEAHDNCELNLINEFYKPKIKWFSEMIKPEEHRWVVVKDKDGEEYIDHQWVGHAWYHFCINSDGTCDGWRTRVDVVSWRYQDE